MDDQTNEHYKINEDIELLSGIQRCLLVPDSMFEYRLNRHKRDINRARLNRHKRDIFSMDILVLYPSYPSQQASLQVLSLWAQNWMPDNVLVFPVDNDNVLFYLNGDPLFLFVVQHTHVRSMQWTVPKKQALNISECAHVTALVSTLRALFQSTGGEIPHQGCMIEI